MSITVNLEELNTYASAAAEEVCGLIEKAEIMVPTALRAEVDSSATNSLDEEFMQDLENGKHLNPDYLKNYYAELATA